MNSKLKCNGELVTINNHKIHIYKKGNKNNPVLVFMSGSGTVSPVYDFKILYSKLVENFRIIVIEKFGYGYSDIFDCDCSIDTVVKLEKEILDILDEKSPYILVPHSMSGLEAIIWKQLYPEKVKGIIGSYAKETWHKDSDIDIAIITNDIKNNIFNEELNLVKLRRKIDTRIEPHLISVDDYKNIETPLIQEIIDTGIKVA